MSCNKRPAKAECQRSSLHSTIKSSTRMFRLTRTLLSKTLAPWRSTSLKLIRRSLTTAKDPLPLTTKTPCELAYIKPCKCWRLQPYVYLDPEGPENENVKGSLDPIPGKNGGFEFDFLDFGEVKLSDDGLLHSETACRFSPNHLIRFPEIYLPKSLQSDWLGIQSPSIGVRTLNWISLPIMHGMIVIIPIRILRVNNVIFGSSLQVRWKKPTMVCFKDELAQILSYQTDSPFVRSGTIIPLIQIFLWNIAYRFRRQWRWEVSPWNCLRFSNWSIKI